MRNRIGEIQSILDSEITKDELLNRPLRDTLFGEIAEELYEEMDAIVEALRWEHQRLVAALEIVEEAWVISEHETMKETFPHFRKLLGRFDRIMGE